MYDPTYESFQELLDLRQAILTAYTIGDLEAMALIDDEIKRVSTLLPSGSYPSCEA